MRKRICAQGAENRIRNLMWTVSGDYGLNIRPDVEYYRKSRFISLYEAVKQGAFARYFDQNELGLYLVKKIYWGAREEPLTELAQLCTDAAVSRRIAKERPGVTELRRRAFSDLLDLSFHRMSASLTGRIKIALIRRVLSGDMSGEKRIRDAVSAICSLEDADTVMEIIRVIDSLYNTLIDRDFEKRCGGLGTVLAVTLDELKEYDWGDFLEEEISAKDLEAYFEKLNQAVTTIREEPDEDREKKKAGRKVIAVDEEAAARMYSYMELNFGRSYLSQKEQEKQNRRLCRGIHADCRLYYTEGILSHPVLANAQYVNARRHAEKNRVMFRNNSSVIARSTEQLAEGLRRTLRHRAEPETQPAYAGRILPRRLWKTEHMENPGKLFEKTQKRNHSDFAVELLIDASGSQRDRQAEVAMQAYILAEALCANGIPLQIIGFCTFWDYTVLQRFRDYEDPRSANASLLNFVTSANNRDGLAIRAAGDSLLQRQEEGKILIVLSDGKPNDIILNRPGSRGPRIYCGETAVKDTAYEVRKLRANGVCVLGVFTGKESELSAEKKIFGKDFAYIRSIAGFARVVDGYLRRLLDEDTANF